MNKQSPGGEKENTEKEHISRQKEAEDGKTPKPQDVFKKNPEAKKRWLTKAILLFIGGFALVFLIAFLASLSPVQSTFRPHGSPNKILDTPYLAWSLLISFVFLGLGFADKTRSGHLAAAFGWFVMGLFWVVQTGDYLWVENNPTNAVGSILSLPFFWFLSATEILSFKREEESRSMRFIAGMALTAGVPYYLIEFSDAVAAGIIRSVAYQTWWVLYYLMGWKNTSLLPTEYGVGPEGISVPIEGTSISIILACTAIQAIVIFLAAIICTEAPWKRKIKAFLWSVPLIHVLNIVRNVGIIWLVRSEGWDFELAHSYVGKGFSLLVLIFISLKVFDTLPELHENIWGVVEQYKRWLPKKPGKPSGAGNGMESINGEARSEKTHEKTLSEGG